MDEFQASGTFVAKSDGTYSMAFTMSGSGRECVPASAVSPPSGPAACADFQEARENTLLAHSSAASVTCGSLQDGGCDCAYSWSGSFATDSGTYTTGAHITLMSSSYTILATEYTYCSTGNRLLLSPWNTDTGPNDIYVTGTIELEAQ